MSDINGQEVIELTGAFCHTAVRADRTGDERQRILLRNHIECIRVQALIDQTDILGDILTDRASAVTRRRIAVKQRHLFLRLAGGQRLDGLLKMRLSFNALLQRFDRFCFRTVERAVFFCAEYHRQLVEAVITAGL